MKTQDWTINDLKAVCKKLKNGKARDEFGIIFELFKDAFAGPDVLNSLTLLFNGIKENMLVPAFMEKMAITSLYKNKGVRSDFANQCGIFNLSKVKAILNKFIYV